MEYKSIRPSFLIIFQLKYNKSVHSSQFSVTLNGKYCLQINKFMFKLQKAQQFYQIVEPNNEFTKYLTYMAR